MIQLKFNPDMCTKRTLMMLHTTLVTADCLKKMYLTPEMLLVNITIQEEFKDFCQTEGYDLIGMVKELRQHVEQQEDLPNGESPMPTVGFERLLDEVAEDANENDDVISIIDFMISLSGMEGTFAAYIIAKYLDEDYNRWTDALYLCYDEDIMEYYAKKKNVNKDNYEDDAEDKDEEFDDDDNPFLQRAHSNARSEEWKTLVTDISATYKNHNPLIGRTDELEQTIQALCQKDKNNVIHVGEAGVGKTALVYGLAQMIDEGNVPFHLRDKHIYMLEMGTLLAGASYQGEFEKRIKTVMEGMKKHGHCICYIDDIHTIMSTGGAGSRGMDASYLLRPYLEDGSICFIGSTTYQEFNKQMSMDKGIVRRFQQIDILEPSVEDSITILRGLISSYEKHHHVKFTDQAVTEAVEQSARMMADHYLPDKAITLIDSAGAYRQMHPLRAKNGNFLSAGRQKVDADLIREILAKMCRVSPQSLKTNGNEALQHLEERIGQEIYGQQEAINYVVRAVKMAKAGLTMEDKPLASLLFVGPTGVGKTEVCKVLARTLGIELVRFDMSEYTEKHTLSKLIGSPAGYVGYDDGGLLTDAIRKSPNCVLLLDEIEKAHSDIYNILLQVMDYARLTDNKGRKADFKNVILIMTSNAGAQHAHQASIGFGGGLTRGDAMLQSVKHTFKPEFLNRLSGTVVFNDMDEHMATLILQKKLQTLSTLLAKKNVKLEVTPEAQQLLLEKGYSRQYGAREMDRTIQRLLNPLLMDEILFGKLKQGGTATIKRDGDGLCIG